jgi:hypothetical protein
MAAVQGDASWPEIFSRYQVNLVMLVPDRPLLKQLQQADWKLLYQDSQAVIYGR